MARAVADHGVIPFLTCTRGRDRLYWTDWLTYAYLALGIFLMFGPVVWVLLSSFKTQAQLLEFPPSLLPYGQVTAEVEGHAEPLPLYRVELPSGEERVLAQVRRVGIQAQLVDPDAPGELVKVNIDAREPVRAFSGEPEPLPPETQAQFVNGFRGIGDLPCRRRFRSTMAERSVEFPERVAWQEYDLGADAPQLEFSSFWHVPTHVQRFPRSLVEVGLSGDYLVRVETCGGVRLWVDGRPAACFTPFARNQPRQTEVRLPLVAGRNELILHLEELCERDTTWVVALVWQDERPARLSVPAPGGAAMLEQLARIVGACASIARSTRASSRCEFCCRRRPRFP